MGYARSSMLHVICPFIDAWLLRAENPLIGQYEQLFNGIQEAKPLHGCDVGDFVDWFLSDECPYRGSSLDNRWNADIY